MRHYHNLLYISHGDFGSRSFEHIRAPLMKRKD